MNTGGHLTGRQRSRIACGPCRERKRKCIGGGGGGGGGDQPCNLCRDFGYECNFRTQARRPRRNARGITTTSSAPPLSPPNGSSQSRTAQQAEGQHPQSFVSTSGSNSGPAFVRTFALAVDPRNAPPFQMLGWNVFCGERRRNIAHPAVAVTQILNEDAIHDLVNVYFEKIDPCYGFLDREDIEQRIVRRWQGAAVTMDDAILCGVGAIACVFSTLQSLDTESQLIDLLKSLLDLVMSEPATVDIATAWILRTVYLRLTAKPDEGWMASCITLHTIDSARLQCEPDPHDHFHRVEHDCDPDIRRRMFGVAQHLNVWFSFDLARSRVRLQNISPISPAARPGDYTTEVLELLPLSEKLDPGANLDGDELIAALASVLARTHTQPPSILAQCNLMLCMFRRIHALKRRIPDDTLSGSLALIERAMGSVKFMIDANTPWHQLANVPFQSICALLAIDSPRSFILLEPAISCLQNLDRKYSTKATSETLTVARALISLHQKRRQTEVQRQSEMLQLYPVSSPTPASDDRDREFEQAVLDLSWFNDFVVDFGDGVG